jgi:hypothetical protein
MKYKHVGLKVDFYMFCVERKLKKGEEGRGGDPFYQAFQE